MNKEELIKLVSNDLPRLPQSTGREPGQSGSDQWFEVNDSSVREMGLEEVLKKKAYLLFYDRIFWTSVLCRIYTV